MNMCKDCLHFCNCSLLLLLWLILIFVPSDGHANSNRSTRGKGSSVVEIQWCGFTSDFHELIQTNHTSGLLWTVPAPIKADQSTVVTFKLKPNRIKCLEGSTDLVTVKLSVTRKPGLYNEDFLTNGYFRAEDSEYFHPREYCISEISDTVVTVRYCNATCGVGNPCIPVCCPLGKLFFPGLKRDNTSAPGITCLNPHEGSSPLSPVLYSNPNTKTDKEILLHFQRKRTATFKCANNTIPLIMPFITNEAAINQYRVTGLCYRIREDGTLMYRDRNSQSEWGEVRNDGYCLGGFQYNSTDTLFRSREDELGIVVCGLPRVQPVPFHSLFYGSTMIVSSVFLLLTLLVHILLWSQQNIHGWTTMCHAASMFFMYLFLGTVFLLVSIYGYKLSHTIGCKIFGIMTHFFFLSTFCWLTLINFDLFWTFRCMAPRSQRSKGLGRFVLYMLFGWGLPFVFVTVSVVLDLVYGSEPCNTILTPEYGVFDCYVSKYALGHYVYYPVAVLWSVNLLFFCTTTYKLYVYKKSTRIATQNINERQKLFHLLMKLFFVMGFTWIFEFVSWLHAGNEMRWYWTIIDILNLFQAVAIFIIFVCKPDILCSLRNKYPALKPFLRPIHICLTCRTPARESDPCTSFTTADEAISSSFRTKPSMRISS